MARMFWTAYGAEKVNLPIYVGSFLLFIDAKLPKRKFHLFL